MPTPKAPAKPALVYVKPNPNLSPLEYVPGIPAKGMALPAPQARELIKSGLCIPAKES
jgi:hypothetical protein